MRSAGGQDPVRLGHDSEDSARPLILWIVPWLLATVAPGLIHVARELPMTTRVSLGVAMTIPVGVVAVVLVASLSRGFSHRIRWAFGVSAIALVALFQWQPLTNAGRLAATALHAPILTDIVPVALAVGIIWLAVRLAGETVFTLLITTGLLAVVITAVLAGQARMAGAPDAVSDTEAAPGSPDVVLLILDGYAGNEVLEQTFAFDNTDFGNDLEELGFEVAEGSWANYSFTYGALATMLNMDYVFDTGDIAESEVALMRSSMSGDPALYRLFHTAGYEVAFAENAWGGSYCGGAVDLCWRDGLAERALWNLGRMTIIAPLLDSRPHPFNTSSFDNLRRLPEIVEADRTEGVPRLTVAHVILPHPPLLLDASCKRQSDQDRRPLRVSDSDALERRRPYFVEQLMCTNTMVLQSLRTILSANGDTIVMITGDHGSELTHPEDTPIEEWTDDEVAHRMKIFSAYRLPGCEGLIYPRITPVNGIRLAANCAIEANLGLLDDRNYWAPSSPSGHVVDVAARLGS